MNESTLTTGLDQASARVVSVQDDIVSIESVADTPLTKNEVIYILPSRSEAKHKERLKAEVLRIYGNRADAQVYENTTGVGVGDPVVQTGELLSVELGPGLLGQVYDGLQNPLDLLATEFGYFLPRGVDLPALDQNTKWAFTPCVQTGAKLYAGCAIGAVQERRFSHKIMVPFDIVGEVEVTWIQEGNVTVDEAVAKIKLANDKEQIITLKQRWPIRLPLSQQLLRNNVVQRQYPSDPLITHLRLIDTFFPIARGGTGCIPGPFGAGKTVLQSLISRNSEVDIVIVVACGERAGEVVETITEFPLTIDPKTGGSLMDRTIIICNTSSMPVAAREASIYTGITLGEYYRQMGLNVLLLADSTSRWAQAMRETSARLEEIPGEEAFPAYLDSAIKNIYERAGVIKNRDGGTGSLTMIGTVSPAGGNFEEPVTQSTLSTVKTFLGLSADRAYKRFYPAVDPLLSWSRYLEQLRSWYDRELISGWTERVSKVLDLLVRGDSVYQMIQVAGEEGVTLEDFVLYQQAMFIDMIYLQQDAFDDVDVSVPLDRQKEIFMLIIKLVDAEYRFTDQNHARDYFTRLTGLFKNLNYAVWRSAEYNDLLAKIENLYKSVDN
ncbi:V-type ATP synthase subunit A [Methylotuvimicrobium alcaliphilum]|uniref:V-type ATP synthase alpha chain n=1 Tax=Methylotuvimicrobium alcaliphilum (strain DSM 19304 / NCIMB 14124 / VKM B-2133 / 20Z) TaxID=1091494 RepID=G4T054_META2|nr:V-type ATP synthase subunit A [Methylotuvimicrobium alcaliphilum]CCE23344.1 V-type ATP synthase alpha chain 1 [Methylotuvimicrobium alcaliphilum 20Z]